MNTIRLFTVLLGLSAATQSFAQTEFVAPRPGSSACNSQYTINANGYSAVLSLNQSWATIQFNGYGVETLQLIRCDGRQLNFVRPGAPNDAWPTQTYYGTFSYTGGTINLFGTFENRGRTYNWSGVSTTTQVQVNPCTLSYRINANGYGGTLDLGRGVIQFDRYPAEWISNVVCDGNSLSFVRPATPNDASPTQTYFGTFGDSAGRISLFGTFDNRGKTYNWSGIEQ